MLSKTIRKDSKERRLSPGVRPSLDERPNRLRLQPVSELKTNRSENEEEKNRRGEKPRAEENKLCSIQNVASRMKILYPPRKLRILQSYCRKKAWTSRLPRSYIHSESGRGVDEFTHKTEVTKFQSGRASTLPSDCLALPIYHTMQYSLYIPERLKKVQRNSTISHCFTKATEAPLCIMVMLLIEPSRDGTPPTGRRYDLAFCTFAAEKGKVEGG